MSVFIPVFRMLRSMHPDVVVWLGHSWCMFLEGRTGATEEAVELEHVKREEEPAR